MGSMSKPLNANQIKAFVLFLDGKSPEEIGQELACSKRTIERWQALPAFREAIAFAVKNGRKFFPEQQYDDRVAQLLQKSLAEVERCLDNPEEPTRYRLQACSLVVKLVQARGAYPDPIPSFWDKGWRAISPKLTIEDRS